jgi:hypothetical protein
VEKVLKKLLEETLGQIPKSTLKEILELATTDIKVNHIGFNKRTRLKYAVGVAEQCYSIIQR